MSPAELPESDDAATRAADTQRSTWVSVVVNIGLTISQVVAGIVSGSQGLIADGIHSLSDLVADFVVLLAVRHSRKAPDEDHHYGHHRYETAASLVLGGLLLAVGIGMLWSAIAKLGNPDNVAPVQKLALWVAIGALVVKEGLFRYMLAVAERLRSTMLVANAWHARSDAASSLVVAVGIGGSLLGFPLLDPVAALIVGLMVAKMGWKFTWDALHDLMDRAAGDEHIEAIQTTLCATPGVVGVHDLKTRKMGDFIVLDVHLEVDDNISVREGHDIAVAARNRIMAAFPVLSVMTHLDPAESLQGNP